MNAAIARTIWGGTWPAMAGRYTCARSELATRHPNQKHTFIRAFESSPVHCLKPRPSGKRRRPGNKGTAAMLMRDLDKIRLQFDGENTHRRSISASISFACVFPWTFSRYSVTHSTRWSLNVPLMTWWRRSGDRSS